MPARRRAQEARRATAAAPPALPPVWEVDDQASAEALADEIFRDNRPDPILVVSVASDTRRPRVPVDDLRHAAGGRVHVALLTTPGTAYCLSESLPEDFQVYGGAVRIYGPGARTTDDPWDHPLFTTASEADAQRTIDRVRTHLVRRGYSDPETQAATPATPVEVPWASEEVDDSRSSREDWLAEQLAAAKADNVELRKAVRSLTDKVEHLERQIYQTDVFSDPEEQLRHEIRTHWLLTHSEPERDRNGVADYIIGPDFLESLDATDGVPRDKVIACIVDVLTGRAHLIDGRQVHQMRVTDQPGSPHRTRGDNAMMWRASLQVNTPQARRLMWWLIPGGVIELAAVGRHDDPA